MLLRYICLIVSVLFLASCDSVVSSSGFKNNSATTTPIQAPASEPKIVMVGVPNIQTGQCSTLSVISTDSLGNPSSVSENLTVNLLGNGNGTYFEDATCTTLTTTAKINSGSSLGTVYFKNSTSEILVLSAQASGYLSTSFPLQVLPAGYQSVALKIVGPVLFNSNTCIPFTVNAIDSNGINFVANTDILLSLANIGGSGMFYSDECTTSTTTLTITSGTSYTSFYYKNATAQNSLITATAIGLGVGSLPLLIKNTDNSPSALKITGLATIGLYSCVPFVVTSIDTNGYAQPVSANTTINLGGGGANGQFYTDACMTPTSSVQISAGSSYQQFYFKGLSAENLIFLTTATNLSMGSAPISIVSTSGGTPLVNYYAAVKLVIAGPSDSLSGACSGEYSVYSADASGTNVAVTMAMNISLSDGPGSGSFYSDINCTPGNLINNIAFANGNKIKTFYYKNDQAESVSLLATTTSLIAGSFPLNVVQAARLTISREVNSELWSNFFYQTFGTVSDYKIFVTNVGQTEARDLAVQESLASPFSFKGGSFPGQGGTCIPSQTLYPSEQCSLVVRFQPSATSSFPENFTLSYSNGMSTLNADHPLNGEGSDLLAPKSVVAGYNHSCIRYSDMSVKCWGNNNYGQLGVGDTVNYGTSAEDIERLSWTRLAQQTIALGAGESHTCAVNQDGNVSCWGNNAYGQLGIGSSVASKGKALSELAPSYVSLGTGRTALSVAVGSNFTCTILDNGKVKCWGNNDYGQLGLGDKINRGLNSSEMGDNLGYVDLGPGRTAVALSAGGYHVCAILDTNSVKCWGRNFYGQLGLGDTNNRGDNSGEMGGSLPTVNVGGGITIRQIAAAHEHTCVILVPGGSADAQVNCWGRNDVGQLGVGDNFSRGTSPSHMGSLLKKVDLGLAGNPNKLAMGGTHTCVLLQNGSVKCWGGNSYGQLGLGSTYNIGDGPNELGNNLPSVSMGGAYLAQDITAGYEHTCVVLDNREVRCWGRGELGQLGHFQLQNISARGQTSTSIATLPNSHVNNYSYAENIASGTYLSCAIFGKNSVSCWGTSNVFGSMPKYQSHLGTWIIANAANIVVGSKHVCVRSTDNKLWCWGGNDYGQLGRGSYTVSEVPLQVATDAVDVSAYGETTCYIATNEMVYCVGRSDNSQAGQGSTRFYSWYQVSGVSSATKISVGGTHACALTNTGSIYCWGTGSFGQLGRSDNGTGGYVTAAAVNLNGRTAKNLSLGSNHSCALFNGANDGQVICWGNGGSGQLGNGNGTSIGDGAGEMAALTSINLGSGLTVKAIRAFDNSTCATLSNDRAKCWGAGNFGDLGNDSGSDFGTSSVQMGDNLPYVALGSNMRFLTLGAASYRSICAVTYDVNKPLPTQTFCWGYNAYGQLGDGGTTNRGSTVGSMTLLPLILNPKVGTGSASTILADYQAPGSNTFTVPEGVTAIEVQAWGGGGGSVYSSCWGGPGAGSGGGGYVKKNYTGLSAGKQFSLSVGAGGIYGNSGCGDYHHGSSSWFDNSSALVAGGGLGSSYISSIGTGGTATGGDVNIAGENGVTTGGNGGAASLGGMGGYGANVIGYVSQSSYNGGYPGGGGGGGANGTYGGSGGNGRIIIKNSSTNSNLNSTVGTTYNNTGVYVYTVPNGVYSLRIQMWGGGGGGGGGGYYSACGGGSSGYIDHVMQVNPGNSYLVSVGAGGIGGIGGNTGTNGGDSRFGFGSEIITAGGGAGGFYSVTQTSTCSGTGLGVGGIALNGVISTNGNRGLTSSPNAPYRGTSGGDAPPSGTGGLGGVNATNCHGAGAVGQAPGGGGAGAHDSSGNWCGGGAYTGGTGGSGRVIVTPFFTN